MLIQEIFDAPAIREIETMILHGCDSRNNKETIKTLLDIRKTLLDGMFVMDEGYKQLLSDFNRALRTTLLDMRMKTITAYESVAKAFPDVDVEARGKCFLGYEYSSIHPIQTTRAKDMWEYLNGCIDCYDVRYADGITFNYSASRPCSELHLLYLTEHEDNWNEHLDAEMTQDMNLIYPFHNLYCNMQFSIFDLLWVRNFNTEVAVEF